MGVRSLKKIWGKCNLKKKIIKKGENSFFQLRNFDHEVNSGVLKAKSIFKVSAPWCFVCLTHTFHFLKTTTSDSEDLKLDIERRHDLNTLSNNKKIKFKKKVIVIIQLIMLCYFTSKLYKCNHKTCHRKLYKSLKKKKSLELLTA